MKDFSFIHRITVCCHQMIQCKFFREKKSTPSFLQPPDKKILIKPLQQKIAKKKTV